MSRFTYFYFTYTHIFQDWSDDSLVVMSGHHRATHAIDCFIWTTKVKMFQLRWNSDPGIVQDLRWRHVPVNTRAERE